jgi:hypothetical protein
MLMEYGCMQPNDLGDVNMGWINFMRLAARTRAVTIAMNT